MKRKHIIVHINLFLSTDILSALRIYISLNVITALGASSLSTSIFFRPFRAAFTTDSDRVSDSGGLGIWPTGNLGWLRLSGHKILYH